MLVSADIAYVASEDQAFNPIPSVVHMYCGNFWQSVYKKDSLVKKIEKKSIQHLGNFKTLDFWIRFHDI